MASRTSKKSLSTWQPGLWNRFPWSAALGLGGFAVCCVAAGVVLSTSNGRKVSTWPIESLPVEVSVLLALIISVANLCLAMALSKAYDVAWWLKAMRGAELRRLKFDQDIQSDIYAFLSKDMTIDKFALAAAVAFGVALMDGTLIQKASSSEPATFHPPTTNVRVDISNGSLPADFSSYSGGQNADLLMPLFSSVSRDYANRKNITIPAIEGCTGKGISCNMVLPATGFDISCVDGSVGYNFSELTAAGPIDSVNVFEITTAFGQGDSYEDFSTVNISSLFKPSAACGGEMTRRNCTLRLATVQYSIVASNNDTVTLQPWMPGENHTIELTRAPKSPFGIPGDGFVFTGSAGAGGFQTMLGGINFVLDELYSSMGNLRLADMTDVPYIFNGSGQSASNYLTSQFSTYGNCTMTWEDPTADIVNTARELMLRSAIAYSAANSSAVVSQQLTAQPIEVVNAYQSHYKWLAITIAIMFVQALAAVYLLFGWHRLGRAVSMDSWDLARALGAPLLLKGGSVVDIDEALESLKRTRLRYGEVADDSVVGTDGDAEARGLMHSSSEVEEGSDSVQVTERKDTAGSKVAATNGRRLGLDVEDRVRDIRSGVQY